MYKGKVFDMDNRPLMHNSLIPIVELEVLDQKWTGFSFHDSKLFLESLGLNIAEFYVDMNNPLAAFCYYKYPVLIEFPAFTIECLTAIRIHESVRLEKLRLNTCIEASNFSDFFFIINRRLALEAYLREYYLIPDNKKYSLFWYIYSLCNLKLSCFTNEFINNILSYSSEIVPASLLDKDDCITIYRGQGIKSRPINEEYSWTNDVNIAISNACESENQRYIYQARVSKDQVLAYIKRKNQKELIIRPKAAQNIKKLQYPSLKENISSFNSAGIMDLYYHYIDELSENYFHRPRGIHGLLHTKRVLFLSLILANKQKLSDDDIDLLANCALYHDIGRKNDNFDPFHGKLSYRKLQRLQILDSSYKNQELLRFIIENHCLSDANARKNICDYRLTNKNKAILLLELFKDADGLDRIRINDLDINQLRTDYARRLPLLARELFTLIDYNRELRLDTVVSTIKRGEC